MKPTIKELLVYTPAQDFEQSKRFYTALGFILTEGWGNTMDCRLGGAAFRLQNYYVKDWAENFMMKFDVDDVPAWYEHAKSVISEGDFGSAECRGNRNQSAIQKYSTSLIRVECC